MAIPPSAPYDTLATVTGQTRIVLADWVQGIQPNLTGTVNTSGLIVTWVSGNKFTALLNGVLMTINGLPYKISTVLSPTSLSLVASAGAQAGVAFSAIIPTGDIFSDDQAYVLPTVNLAWRKLQKKLDYSSHPRMRNEVDIFSLPVAGSSDPATRQWISWTQFFDGVTTTNSPTLPTDFLAPMRLRERQSVTIGQVNPNRFSDMFPATDGLPLCTKGSRNGWWDWREDALYFVGSILNMDLHIDYQAFLPDIAVAGGGFGSTSIPIMRCSDALAYYTAAIFVEPRGGAMTAPSFMAKGDAATDALTNRQGKVLQRGSYRRRAVYDSAGQYRRRCS